MRIFLWWDCIIISFAWNFSLCRQGALNEAEEMFDMLIIVQPFEQALKQIQWF